MAKVIPIRNDVLPAPFLVYQRKGFVECKRSEADGWIEHTSKGAKHYWLRDGPGAIWMREVTAREYLEAMR